MMPPVFSSGPHQRSVGYVFQEPSLFRHLAVRDNLMYGSPAGCWERIESGSRLQRGR